MNNEWKSIVKWNDCTTIVTYNSEKRARQSCAEMIKLSSVKSVSVREVKPKKKGRTMTIKISEDENTVEVDGKKYVAEYSDTANCACLCHIGLYPCMREKIPCTKRRRKDKRNVIFKRGIDKLEIIVYNSRNNKLSEVWQ